MLVKGGTKVSTAGWVNVFRVLFICIGTAHCMERNHPATDNWRRIHIFRWEKWHLEGGPTYKTNPRIGVGEPRGIGEQRDYKTGRWWLTISYYIYYIHDIVSSRVSYACDTPPCIARIPCTQRNTHKGKILSCFCFCSISPKPCSSWVCLYHCPSVGEAIYG